MTLDECANELAMLSNQKEVPSDYQIEAAVIRYLMNHQADDFGARRALATAYSSKVKEQTDAVSRVHRSICARLI